MEGTVKEFARNRGFGFITAQTGQDVFVHHTDLVDEDRDYLVPGQRVRFQVKESERGPRAVQVSVIAEVPLDNERQLDWRGRRHGHPRAGKLPQAALRARGLPDEEDAEEGEG